MITKFEPDATKILELKTFRLPHVKFNSKGEYLHGVK